MDVHGTKFQNTKDKWWKVIPTIFQETTKVASILCHFSGTAWAQASRCITSIYVSICTHTYAYTPTTHVFISIPNTSISCMFMHVFFSHLTMWLQDLWTFPINTYHRPFLLNVCKMPHCRDGPWFFTPCSELMIVSNFVLLQTLL